MYQLCHNITIGSYRLKLVDEVRIVKSIDSLSDTATIRVPGAVMNRAIEVESKIAEGDSVEIELGYDGDLYGEFRGYVDRVSTDGGTVTIECVDSLYLFKRKSLRNRQYKKIALRELLKQVCAEVNGLIEVDCDYDVVYDTFTVYKATGYDVLSKVQDDIKANIYFSGRTLRVHAPYKYESGDVVRYDFGRNVEKSDLRYVRARDKKVEVELTIYAADGTSRKVSYGTTGGQKVERTSVTMDERSARKLARDEYEALVYDGYEGSFTGWLLPFVQPTYAVELKDQDYPEKDGRYYVVGVEVQYSRSGGVRRVTLGRRVG